MPVVLEQWVADLAYWFGTNPPIRGTERLIQQLMPMVTQEHKQFGFPYSPHDVFLLLGEFHGGLPMHWLHLFSTFLVAFRFLGIRPMLPHLASDHVVCAVLLHGKPGRCLARTRDMARRQ